MAGNTRKNKKKKNGGKHEMEKKGGKHEAQSWLAEKFSHTQKKRKRVKKKSIMISRRTVKRLNVYRVLTLSTRP